MKAAPLLSLIMLVSLCPEIAAKQFTCGPGDVRREIDIETIALKYEGRSFTLALNSLSAILLETSLSFDRKTLQQATVTTQHWNELLKGLVAGFNSCAITKEQYAEALKSLYPKLKTQAADLDGIRNLLAEGRQLDEKRLQGVLKQYSATLKKFASLIDQKLILEQLQAVEARVVAGQDKILNELEQLKQRLRPPLLAPNLPGKEVVRELARVRKEFASLSERVEKEYAEGISYYDERKFDTAISHFRNAIDLVPRIPSLYLALGNSYYANIRYSDAVATYERGMREAEQSEEIYVYLLANRGAAKDGLGHHQDAIDDLSRAITLNPDHAGPYISRGVAKYWMEDFQGAIDDYTDAINLRPDDADAYYNRSLTKVRRNDFLGAIADATKSIELSPDHADVYRNRGVAKGLVKDFQGAVKDYTEMIGRRPDDAESYYDRGMANYWLKDFQGAIADFTATINLRPPSLEMLQMTYWVRGFAHTGLGNEKDATEDFKKARELHPKSSSQTSSTH